MKNPLMAALATVVTLTLTQPANAQSVGDGYVGFSIGQTELDDACDGNAIVTVTSCDDEDTGLAIYAGYNFHENFAVEGGYIDFGESTTDVVVNSTSATTKNELWSLYGAGVGKINVSERVTLFGKIGFHRWEADVKLSSANSISFDDDGFDLFYGVGGQVSMPGDKLKIRLEYQIFEVEDPYDGEVFSLGSSNYQFDGSSNDVNFLSLGITYTF
ncbi:MAG: porin family protein [Gammaproteobacteria bacterium]|nr:porin family protein [Gammaproteobacteria bacterium]